MTTDIRTFADLDLEALFFLGVSHGGPLLKKVDALGYAWANTLVLSTSSFMKVDPSAAVTPMRPDDKGAPGRE